jgi:hypothetical protein
MPQSTGLVDPVVRSPGRRLCAATIRWSAPSVCSAGTGSRGATGWADFHVQFIVTGFEPPMIWPAEYSLAGGVNY